jgi:hypothetical protein
MVLNVTNRQGVMVDELIDDVDETIDSTANTVAIHIGR